VEGDSIALGLLFLGEVLGMDFSVDGRREVEGDPLSNDLEVWSVLRTGLDVSTLGALKLLL